MISPSVPNATDFAALGLTPALAQAATSQGWAQPRPVQVQAIAALLQGRDARVLAPTGSGKTAAFLLPLLQRLDAQEQPVAKQPRLLRALILAPTRELAEQTSALAQALAPQIKTVLAIGGAAINPQMMALRGGAHLVVATPGRLLDLVRSNALSLSAVNMLVLDEADRLLDLGFSAEIEQLLALLPAQRQCVLVSATMPAAVAQLAANWLQDPLHVDVRAPDASEQPAITQRAILVDTAQRTPLLRHLIRSEGWDRVLVFVATQYASEHVADKLRQAGVSAAALHGRLSIGRRRQALADLHSGALSVLVATDLAARGIDVVNLAAVVNHDLARSAVDHLHRIGRTGRAGASGAALSFICADVPASEAHFRLIEKRQQQRVAREQVSGFGPQARPVVETPPTGMDPTGGVKGRRKSRKDKLREAAVRVNPRR